MMSSSSDFIAQATPHVLRSLAIIAGTYLIGLAINAWVMRRLARLAAATRGEGDDLVVAQIRHRIPLWSLLIGTWIAIGRLPLDPHTATLADRLVFTVATLSVSATLATIATGLLTNYGRSLTPPLTVTALSRSIIVMSIMSIGTLVVLNSFGVSVTPMLTALGVGGLAVALALQEPLSNLFAGLFVTLAGQIRVGDYIKLDGGLEGHVQDFGWRSARIRQLANNIVLVPNSKLAQAIVINYTLPEPELLVTMDVVVGYAADLEQVERIALDVAAEVLRDVAGGVPDFTPLVRFHTFTDTSIAATVVMRARDITDQGLIKHEFAKRLQRRFRTEGIAIPAPVRAVVMAGPNAS